MPRQLRAVTVLAAGALGAAAVRSARRPRAAVPAVVDVPTAPAAPPPPPIPPPVPLRRSGRLWVVLVLGWLGLVSMPLVLVVAGVVTAVHGPDAIGRGDWLVYGSVVTTVLAIPLLWVVGRDDEDRESRNAWAYTLWEIGQRRPRRGDDGTTSGYSSSSSYDPTYGAAWSGGYDSGGGSYDGGGYSGGSDGGGGYNSAC